MVDLLSVVGKGEYGREQMGERFWVSQLIAISQAADYQHQG